MIDFESYGKYILEETAALLEEVQQEQQRLMNRLGQYRRTDQLSVSCVCTPACQ